MAWTDQLPLMLRYVVGDVDTPQKYADARLEQALVIAGKFVENEANFSQSFNCDVAAITISPDPTIDPYIDDWFSNLVVLKAAFQIAQSEFRILSRGGAMMFKEGSATVDTREQAKYYQALYNSLKTQYEDALFKYQMVVRPSVGSVIGPFNIYAGNFRGPVYPYSYRDRLFL